MIKELKRRRTISTECVTTDDEHTWRKKDEMLTGPLNKWTTCQQVNTIILNEEMKEEKVRTNR